MTKDSKVKVTLWPSNESVEVDTSENLLVSLKNSGIPLKSSCGGYANCTDCVVKVKAGSDQMEEPTFAEKKLLGNVFHITKERLACQVFLSGDVEVDITNHLDYIEHQKALKKKVKVKVRKKDTLNTDEKSETAASEEKKKSFYRGGKKRPNRKFSFKRKK